MDKILIAEVILGLALAVIVLALLKTELKSGARPAGMLFFEDMLQRYLK